jgi:hypothetical protein
VGQTLSTGTCPARQVRIIGHGAAAHGGGGVARRQRLGRQLDAGVAVRLEGARRGEQQALVVRRLGEHAVEGLEAERRRGADQLDVRGQGVDVAAGRARIAHPVGDPVTRRAAAEQRRRRERHERRRRAAPLYILCPSRSPAPAPGGRDGPDARAGGGRRAGSSTRGTAPNLRVCRGRRRGRPC